MLYVQIENGKIAKGPGFLPKTYKNMSGFHLLPKEDLKKYGWVPVEGYNCNRNLYTLGKPIIQENKVVYPNIPKDIDTIKKEFKVKFKPIAKSLIAVTDWKVIRHVGQKAAGKETAMTDEQFNSLEAARQALRDRSNQKELEVMNATTIREIFNIRWEGNLT